MTMKTENQVINELVTGILVLENGQVFYGKGCGALGSAVGEVCFNTAITGYQEILTDPSYTDQVVCFTFPHIGNTGTNDEDEEASSISGKSAARGAIFKASITKASNWRSKSDLDIWLENRGIIGLSGIDTRALTSFIRDNGMLNGVIAHSKDGIFEVEDLIRKAKNWKGLIKSDLATKSSTNQSFIWDEGQWVWPDGYKNTKGIKSVVVIDYGVKRNILRNLVSAGLKVTVVPSSLSASEILSLDPDGVVLSNGPGDPEATGIQAIPVIQDIISANIPVLGICLGHQMLALALGSQNN